MIYVLTSGEYSDYHIIMATTDKAKADYFNKLYADSKIEEFDDSKIQMLPMFNVVKYKRDDSIRVFDTEYTQGFELNKVYENDGLYEVYIQAKDRYTALKIFFDLYTQYMAQKEGIS